MRFGAKTLFRLLPLLLALVTGCGAAARFYVNPEADMTYYERVAVVPFTNISGQGYAGDRVARAFVTELIIADRFQVVDPGEFATVLRRIGGEPSAQGSYDPQKLKEAAASVKATGLIRGAVTEYQYRRAGQDDIPVLSFDVEMVDAATNRVVWRASITKKGKGRFPVVGGPSAQAFGRLTQEACVEMVAQLKRKAF